MKAIERFGGKAGVWNEAALDSCVAQPQMAVFGHERFPTLHDKGAAYCFFLCVTHPFYDGNKRTGLLAAIHFLLKNGNEPDFDENAMYDVLIRAVNGQATVGDIAAVFRRDAPPADRSSV